MTKDKLIKKIHPELVKLLYQQVTFGIWAESCAAVGLTLALWGTINQKLLLCWLISNLLFCGLGRHIMVYCFQKSQVHALKNYKNSSFWLTIFMIGAFISGLSWGATGSILMGTDMARQTFQVFLLIGVTAAANPLYSPIKRVYVLFLLPAFIPFVVWLLLQGGIFIILGLLAIIYMMIMLVISSYSYKLLFTSLFFRFKNSDLVDRLFKAKSALEKRSLELEKSLSLVKAALDSKQLMESKLFHQAHYDSLTELPNRVLVTDRISQAMNYSDRSKTCFAILFLDLDRFKMINDTLGHKYGDKLLKAVAERLLLVVRSNDTASRSGGDEFLIILTLLQDEKDCALIACKLVEAFNKPFYIENYKFSTTISIGISLYPRDGHDAETLIRNADIAMYSAKEIGRNNFQFFTEEMNLKIQQRSKIENELRDALAKNELTLLYQPIINLKNGKIVGAEALLRWNHPIEGEIQPSDFVSIAEESGLIISIGEWVLRTACKQIKAWQELGCENFYISVNLSARQFKQENLFETIYSIFKETNINPSSLSLELTETVIMDNVETTLLTLYKLKNMGIMIAIDDFGIGYSSLNYLKELPVDKLKIDISFIRDINYADGSAITAAIIALAEQLHLKVIAEGVENKEQLLFLIRHRCDEIQGFYFSKPLNSAEFYQTMIMAPALPLPI